MRRKQDKVDPNELTRAIWHGKGAAALGLQGEVWKEDFESVLNARKRLKG